MLESRACGKVVLARPIGGLPYVINNEEPWFFMEDDSLDSVIRNVRRDLNHSNLEQT